MLFYVRGYSNRGKTYRGFFSKCTLSNYHRRRRWPLIRVYLDFPDWGQLAGFRCRLPRPRLCSASAWHPGRSPRTQARPPPRIPCRYLASRISIAVSRMISRAMAVSLGSVPTTYLSSISIYAAALWLHITSKVSTFISNYFTKFAIVTQYY